MKKVFFLMFSSLLVLGIMGCSSDDDSKKSTKDKTVETEDKTDESTSDDSTKKEKPTDDKAKNEDASESFDFTDFELEVEYANHQKYEAEYETENGNIEAEIEDDLNDTKIKGDEASEKLEPILKDLNINQDTPKEEAIKDALNVFNLSDDYIKFELEMIFDDSTKIEFEDKK